MPIIYKHTNIITNKSYVGRTIFSLESRLKDHIRCSKKDPAFDFHKAIKEYGIENFSSTILEEVELNNIVVREKYWIKYYDSYKNGYNMNAGGSGYGLLSEKSKEKFRNSINTIESNGISIAKNRYKKRNITLKSRDLNFLKNIGEKSSITQKNNGKNKGNLNPNYNKNYVLVFNIKGDIIDKFLLSDIEATPYPSRAVITSLRNHKPIYLHNKPKNDDLLKYIGYFFCYNNLLYCDYKLSSRSKNVLKNIKNEQ